MDGQTQSPQIEPRWPVALAIVAVILLLALLPGRIRIVPSWYAFVLGLAVLIPIVAVGLTAPKTRWLRIERTVTLIFFVVTQAGTLANLMNLIGAMVNRSTDTGGLQLLTSSIAVWITNVLTFSLLYWQIDRGGPEARANDVVATKSDWLFPQDGAPVESVPRGWHPTFVDYLYLSFSTATAFSTTDAMPLTPRAKLFMMLESATSLVTIAVVASRAINILGT
jgi:hypothetical protein